MGFELLGVPNELKVINTEDFADLHQRGGYYVDKTDFFLEFLWYYGDATLFTRPRRFGKTLFLSMLATFFDATKDSKILFAGLKVTANEALCKTWMNQYPVISLSLKGLEGLTFEDALGALRFRMRGLYDACVPELDKDQLNRSDRETLEQIVSSMWT